MHQKCVEVNIICVRQNLTIHDDSLKLLSSCSNILLQIMTLYKKNIKEKLFSVKVLSLKLMSLYTLCLAIKCFSKYNPSTNTDFITK